MDGPVLVPCEKLDPIPDVSSGPLPRQCSYVATIYYVLIICGSAVVVVVLPLLKGYLNFGVWFDTSLFAAFWSFLVVEMGLVVICAVVSSLRNHLKMRSLSETFSELFPTIDAAAVGDHVYRSQTGNIPCSVAQQESEGERNIFPKHLNLH